MPIPKTPLLSLVVATTLFQIALAQEKFQIIENTEGGYLVVPADVEAGTGGKSICITFPDVCFSGRSRTLSLKAVGPETCSLDECHRWIKKNWTDMRPLSLRKRMESEGLSVDGTKFRVVVNHEEQYSVTIAGEKVAEGWRDVGYKCVLDDCMKYIEEVWTDMRPLSLRKTPGKEG